MHHDLALTMISRPIVAAGGASDLPSSVGEWYAQDDAVTFLESLTNDDTVLPPEQFEQAEFDGLKLTIFMIENQGVVRWAFDSDGGDDPAVYVTSVDDDSVWLKHCESFSEFIYIHVFDYQWWLQDCGVSGIGPPVDPNLLKELERSYTREPTTMGWPGSTQYRFSDRGVRIVLWDTPEVQADWMLSASRREDLITLFERHKDKLEWHSDLPRSEQEAADQQPARGELKSQ